MDIDRLALISSSSMTVQTFLAEATALGIRVPHILELNKELLKEHGQKQVMCDITLEIVLFCLIFLVDCSIYVSYILASKIVISFLFKVQLFLEKAVYLNKGKSNDIRNEVSRPVVALIVEAGKLMSLVLA